jgi:hypothetical protein
MDRKTDGFREKEETSRPRFYFFSKISRFKFEIFEKMAGFYAFFQKTVGLNLKF